MNHQRPTPTSRNYKKPSNHATVSRSFLLYNFISFLIGCILCSYILTFRYIQNEPVHLTLQAQHQQLVPKPQIHSVQQQKQKVDPSPADRVTLMQPEVTPNPNTVTAAAALPLPILYNQRILICVASFNFDQFTFFEEQLEGFRSLTEAGAHVTIIVHTTEPYTPALIDVLNTRMYADDDAMGSFQMKIVILAPTVRLHLVDYHRTVFYEYLDDYDLFIYSEDDMRANAALVANYLIQTRKVKRLLGNNPKLASDYNVGVIRYEYNYPFDVIIDDNTRMLTRNATRVYWEHSQGRPVFEKVVDEVENPALAGEFMTLRNTHQGMFLATQDLLRAWKERGNNCRFDEIRDRPGWKNKPSQPAEGTQRVWMSSVMLYGKKHCDVKLLMPLKSFGKMNVHHLPNKNYRRVGRKGRLGGFAENARVELNFGNITSIGPHPSLMKQYEIHYGMRQHFPFQFVDKNGVYNGIEMIDKVVPGYLNYKKDYGALLQRRMQAYQRYVESGGILTAVDMDEYL